MKLLFPKPADIAESYFKKYEVYQLISNYQHRDLGVDRFMRKIVTRSPRKAPEGVYSFLYGEYKKSLGLDVTRFNFNLTGKFHNSFIQIPDNTSLKIYAETKKDNGDLLERFPDAMQFSNDSINKIIRGGSKYISVALVNYARSAVLSSFIVRQ